MMYMLIPLTWEQLSDWMRPDKPCWLQSPQDLLNAILSCDMNKSLVIQSKKNHIVDRYLLPPQT